MVSPNASQKRAKIAALEHLWAEGRAVFGETRTFVPGEGAPLSPLMIVGEAPGADEERQRRPFVGRAGQILNQALSGAGIRRDETWVTNVVKWRPTAERNGRIVNRSPNADEIQRGQSLLYREMAIIHPRIILCLGNVAARVVISEDFKMSDDHGRWYAKPEGWRVIATYHPAYLLRQRAVGPGSIRELFAQDVSQVGRALHNL